VADVPYTLIDRVMAAARDGPEKGESAVQRKLKVLEDEVKRRIDGLQRL
jgi:nuclear pore complex protein Nup160